MNEYFNRRFRYVNHIFDGPSGPLKAKKYASIISAVSVTPLGLDVLYELLSSKLDNILNEVPDGENIVKHIYSTLASKITNDKDIENVSSKNFTIYKLLHYG